jgi:hypothetical protein
VLFDIQDSKKNGGGEGSKTPSITVPLKPENSEKFNNIKTPIFTRIFIRAFPRRHVADLDKNSQTNKNTCTR